MISWSALDREISCWAAQNSTVTFWWRDDDASCRNDQLDRLLVLAAKFNLPVALAVIPSFKNGSLAERLAHADNVFCLQHGFAHANHALYGEPENEYGTERVLTERLAELVKGRELLEGLPNFLPVLVPPWNRLPSDLLSSLPIIGLRGLSMWGPRRWAQPVFGLQQVNVHMDVMNWETKRFCGLDQALTQLVHHLQNRRLGKVDSDEPTGIMTHHPFHDEAAWKFLSNLLWRTHLHPHVSWLSAQTLFALPESARVIRS